MSAFNNYVKAPTISIEDSIADKPLDSGFRPYRLPLKEGLKEQLEIHFAEYGLKSEVKKAIAVIDCESSWNWNPKPNGISWGIAQFTPPTWKDFGQGDIMNPYVQLETMAKMWKMGLQERWDCY